MDITSLLANIDENILYIICAAVVCLILLTLFFLKSKSGSKDKNKPQEKNKKPKKRNVKKHQKKLKIPKYVQDTIPYINVYPDNGLIETEQGVFTKSYELKDINYQIAKEIEQEDMFVKYGEFLNAFDSNVNVQIVINNRNINQESFEAVTLLPPKGDGHDDLREEYNEMLLQKMSEGNNNMERKKYLTISAKAKSVEEAETIFSRFDIEVRSNLKKVGGSDAIPLTTMERLEILHDIYNIGEEGTFAVKKINNDQIEVESFSFESMKLQGITTKDCIGPSSFEFKSDYFMVGDKYARALYLKDVPTFLADNVLSEITNADCNMLTSLNFLPIASDEALKIVKNRLTNINSNMIEKQKQAAKGGYSAEFTSPELKSAIDEANELLSNLQSKNQKMFLLTLTIVHFADSLEQLNLDTDFIQSTARRFLCEIQKLNLQQENGLTTTLPLAYNKIEIKRTLTTASASVFMPFVSQELKQSEGFYYGLNAVSKNLILFNRKLSKNGNGFIFGTPGSGKSFTAKQEMMNVLLNTDDDVIVIDPEGEYYPMAHMLNGEVINLAIGSDVQINPMDMSLDYADGNDPITFKSDFIISLCETIAGGRSGLSPKQCSIIDRCCRIAYQPLIDSVDPITKKADESKMPTLKDFYYILKDQSGTDAQDLATSIELYTIGSMSRNFANKSNVEYNKRFVVYNIRDLGSTAKSVGLLCVLDNVWNRILENSKKGKYTWVYIDEIYLLFKTDTSANFLRELYKRARKFRGIPTGLTQNVDDLLSNEIARTMISNSEFILMLNQALQDRIQLAELLSISQTSLSYVTNSAPGEGLLYNGSSIIPFVNRFPKNTKMYRAMTTDPKDLEKMKNSISAQN